MKSLQKILVPNLHNFVSGTTVPSTITKKILNCYYAEKSNMEFFVLNIFQTGQKISLTQCRKLLSQSQQNLKKLFLTSNIRSIELSVKKGTEAQKLKIFQN